MLPKSSEAWRSEVARNLNEIGINLFEMKQYQLAIQKFNKV